MSEMSDKMQDLYLTKSRLEPAIILIFLLIIANITPFAIDHPLFIQKWIHSTSTQNILIHVIDSESTILLITKYITIPLLLYVTYIVIGNWNVLWLRYEDIPYGNGHCKRYPKRLIFIWTKVFKEFDNGRLYIIFRCRSSGDSIHCQSVCLDKKSAPKFIKQ